MKSFLQSVLSSFGYDIYKRDARFHSELAATKFAELHGISTIIDIGANVGQYASALREWGYKGKIISFEPLSSAHAKLASLASDDQLWTVAPRCAIGSARSTEEINISANSVSSSLLGMWETHEKASPGSAYSGKEKVEVLTLDEAIQDTCGSDESLYLKMDTQGYEKAVLKGAEQTLKRCAAVQMELSLTPLYDGGFLFTEGIEWMKSRGFIPYSIFHGFTDRESGQTFQVDVVFVPEVSQ